MIDAFAAVDEVAKGPEWYQVATGILAIPGGLLTVVGTYALWRKTRIETRNAELELDERQSALAQAPKADQEAARVALAPLAASRRFEAIILRFVVLCLVLLLWMAVDKILDTLVFGTGLALYVAGMETFDLGPLNVILLSIQRLPDIGNIIIILVFGWPLFREIGRTFGIGLDPRRRAHTMTS